MNEGVAPKEQGAHRHAARFDQERVAELFGLARSAYPVTPLNGALLVLVLWNPAAGPVLIAWLLSVLGVTAARMLLHRAYLRSDSRLSAAAGWERLFAIGAFATGAAWALTPALFFGPGDALERVAVMFVLGGMIIGAAGVYAPSRLAFHGFVLLPVLVSVGVLLAQGARTYDWMAAMVVVFAAALARVSGQLHRSVARTLLTRLENEALVERLSTSEGRLRDAIDSTPDGIAIYDGEDRLLACNAGYAALYAPGKRPEELAGTPFRVFAETAFDSAELVSEADAKDRHGWIERRVARHLAGQGELRQYRTRDGRSLQGKTVRTALGGIVGVFTDISETKRAEAAYQAVLAEENIVLEILPVGVAFIEHRTIVRCNRRLELVLGYEPGELAGKPSALLYGRHDAHASAGPDFDVRLAAGGIVEEDTRMARKDGTPIWCRSLGRALDTADPQAAAIFAFSDAQDRKAAEQALRASEEMYRNLVETSNDLIWALDREGRWTYLNGTAVRRIWGGDAADMLGRPFSESLVGELLERDLAVFRRVLEGGEALQNFETRHRRRDGAPVDLSFNAIALRSPDGEIAGATGTARDVTQAKLAAAALYENVERLRLAVDAADLYYWEWALAPDTVTWGRDPSGLLGAPAAGAHPHPDFRALIHAEDRATYEDACMRAVTDGKSHFCEFRIVGYDGRVRWLAARGNMIYGADGKPARVIGVSQDVTDRKRQEDEVRHFAHHDTLTGLPNRRLLDDRLRQSLFAAQRRATRLAVMVIDLDHFKAVNDSLGHRAGDEVLRAVAGRLAGCVRKADTLARHGGDEFVIVMPDLALESDCSVVAEKILRTLTPAISVEGRSFRIGASIGISLFPADGADGEALLRHADAAMYRAKETGRNTFRFHER